MDELEIIKDNLPEVYTQLVIHIGIENTIEFAKIFGGKYIYFRKAETYSLLVDKLGINNAIKIAKIFGGENVYFQKYESIERPLRNRKIRDEFNGYNFRSLAEKYNLTEIQIRNICNNIIKVKKTSPIKGQINLFDRILNI